MVSDWYVELFSVPEIKVDIRDYTEKDLRKSYGIKDERIKFLYDSGDIDSFFKMINSVYHTRLAVSQFKGHFSKAWLEHNGVSEFIKKCSNIIGKKPYSFSAKVYSFVDPNKYLIIDRNVSSLLREYIRCI